MALLVVGVLAAVLGPGIAVNVGTNEYARGRMRSDDARARIRVPIDPVLTCAVTAYIVVSATFGLHGTPSLVAFAVAQTAAFAALAVSRLRTRIA